MTTYQGPATAITAGIEQPVAASLRKGTSGHLQTWDGVLLPESEEAQWTLFNEGQGRLRLPDGREGDYIATNTTVSPGSTGTRVEITGSGPAPF